MNAAVVELNALTDAIRAATEHQNFLPIAGCCLTLLFVGRVHISSGGRKFGGAGIDTLVDRSNIQRPSSLAHCGFGCAQQISDTLVGEASALEPPHEAVINARDGQSGKL